MRKLRKAVKTPIRRALSKRGIYRLEKGPADYPTHNNTREAVDAFFSDPDCVSEYLTRERFAFYDEVVGLLRDRISVVGRTVADVGCGTGHLLAKLDQAKSRTGYDFSEAALRIARAVCPEARFEQRDIYEPTPDRFDIVLCCETLEHMFYPARALRSLFNMVEDDGALFLTVPNGRRDTGLGHINFWSPESWRVFLHETLPGREIESALFFEDRTLFAFVRPG